MRNITHYLHASPRTSSLILGALSTLSFAPLYLLPAFFVGIWGLLHLLDKAFPKRQVFERLYFFGLGFFIAGLYWIGFSFRTMDMGWFGFPAVFVLSAFLALFFVPIVFFMMPFRSGSIERRIGFAIGFALSEWLRGHILTGLPWNVLGSIWGAYTWPYASDFGLSILQITAWIGVYGLSFLTILAGVLVTSSHRVWRIAACTGIIVISIAGMVRLKYNQTDLSSVNMRLIQPSLDQHLKWLPESFERNLELQIALSSLEAERPLSAIIWPESAVTKVLNESTELCDVLSSVVPKDGVLIVGAPRRENQNIFTTLSVINEQGEIIQNYKKTHLVPFGEYVPCRNMLSIIKPIYEDIDLVFTKLTYGTFDFSPGDGLKTLRVPNLPTFSPLICYEALFPGKVTDSSGSAKRPEWLLNITNDAWYGVSAGPYQHLALVRIRAIEEGLPLVRVANNGVSAVIDPCGRILHKLGLNDVGFVDFELPKAISPTLYSFAKETIFWLSIILTFVGILLQHRRKV